MKLFKKNENRQNSIIVGEEEFIPYPSQKKPPKRKSGMER